VGREVACQLGQQGPAYARAAALDGLAELLQISVLALEESRRFHGGPVRMRFAPCVPRTDPATSLAGRAATLVA
jgi:hypothetical protein